MALRPRLSTSLPLSVHLHCIESFLECNSLNGVRIRDNQPASTCKAGWHLFFGEDLFQFLVQDGEDLEEIAHNTVIGDLKNGRVRVFVHGDDDLGRRHAGDVLNCARNAGGNVQLLLECSEFPQKSLMPAS